MENNMIQQENGNQPEDLEVMFAQLEAVIKELEGDDVSLERSFVLYNQGMETIQKCSSVIDTVEKKVQVIDKNGAYHDF